jgi:hypothetical protein
LRTSIAHLAALSTSITRQLDYTYYNLLEKVSSLLGTIHSFRELLSVTNTFSREFTTQSNTLLIETENSINDFKNFSLQSSRISELEKRLKRGRERAEELATRLDVVRERVEAWEKREGDWERRANRRLRILWGSFATALILIAVLLFSHKLGEGKSRAEVFGGQPGTSFTNRTVELGKAAEVVKSEGFHIPEGTCGWMGRGIKGLPEAEGEKRDTAWKVTREEDERLRVFDEL